MTSAIVLLKELPFKIENQLPMLNILQSWGMQLITEEAKIGLRNVLLQLDFKLWKPEETSRKIAKVVLSDKHITYLREVNRLKDQALSYYTFSKSQSNDAG